MDLETSTTMIPSRRGHPSTVARSKKNLVVLSNDG